MKVAKINKFASTLTATECAVAFKKLFKLMQKLHKDYLPHENHDTAMIKAYYACMQVICLFRLQHSFYPLELNDFRIKVDGYFEIQHDFILYAINCMNPILKRLPKLDMNNSIKLVQAMRKHLKSYILDDLHITVVSVMED